MNFQGLKEVAKPDFYLDVALRRATKKATEARAGVRNRDLKTLIGEKTKVRTIATELNSAFSRLIKSFPSMDNLHPFYQELINLHLDVGELKKALGSLDWAGKQTNSLARQSLVRMKGEVDPRDVKTAFIGRVASILKQIRKYFVYLERARKIIVKFPNIKTSLFTVAIAGFPNVGKSTLLSKITPARPDIQAYAFTTRRLNMGYLRTMKEKLQLIDTPGTLARFNKMNWIEQQAYLAMKFVSHAIIYVFDLTEASYPIADQLRLYKQIKEHHKPILIYFSKTDLLDDEVEAFCKEHREIKELKERAINPQEMKERLLQLPKH